MANRTLQTYETKRDFARTAEPRGSARAAARGGSLRYVVQKHDARRLHFDLRLELDGVLKSWAVTRGPSLNPSDKRLAVRTEDHPIDYESFEGTIPKGEYGGGSVMVWDWGTWEPKGDAHQGLELGVLKFELKGMRLKGGFALVRLGRKSREMRENWLLIKERDAFAVREADVTERWRTSVVTGRSMDTIAAGGEPKKEAKRGRRTSRGQRAEQRALKVCDDPEPHRRGAQSMRGKRARTFAPQLATLVTQPPEGPDWLHEIKYDGYRVIAEKHGREVRLFTRSGLDWTATFAEIADAVRALSKREVVLDGEIVVFDAKGKSDFGLLQAALKGGGETLTYVVFDLLQDGERDLRREPLAARKTKLARVLDRPPAGLMLGDAIAGDGAALFQEMCRLGLEGMVSKRRDSIYVPVRSMAWVKCKCTGRDEFVVIGFKPSSARGRAFSSLLVGDYDDAGVLHYRGRVGTGFDGQMLDDLMSMLKPLERVRSAAVDVPKAIGRTALWVEPRLVAEVSYTELTRDGILRHPVFVGLRADKRAPEVKMVTRIAHDAPSDRSMRTRGSETTTFEGVRLTHPSRVLFAESGATKLDLARYYAAVAPLMLPHIRNRPLSFVRCPEGSDGECFFQKHSRQGLPKELSRVPVRESSGKTVTFVGIESRAGLVAAAQVGAIELHIWGSRADELEKPDRLLIDLDPDEALPFDVVREAAFDVRDVFDAAGLKTFALLTGGKGVHVIAPIERRHSWDEVKAFTQGIAVKLAASDPTRFVANMAKAKRRGRIFLDYLRNERGATGIAPYSVRAKAQDRVAMPVSWEGLRRAERASLFSMEDALAQLRTSAWTDYFSTRQRISSKAMAFFS